MNTNHLGPIIAARDGLQVCQCQTCGYAHLTEFPSEAELARYYELEFWQTTKPNALADFERQAEWWKAVHGDWLECAGQHTAGRDLLDVGAGYAFFMDLAKENGWNPWGIEPNNSAYKYADETLGWQPWNCTWEQWHEGYPKNEWRFDCISALWIIEHMHSPLEFLQQTREHLFPGGVLLAVIPQEWTEAQAAANEVVQKKAWWLDGTHLNYFSQTTFANLLGRAGFRIVDLLSSWPIENFITDFGSNYVDNPALGRLCHRAIEKTELDKTREQRITDARARAKYGKGRDLIVVAKYD